MIPIKLIIKGIYSYQETCCIDFEKLLEGQLFGIFGSVGSGKSTILEAISFVLYGETERLNNRGDARNYNMMNLKSNDLLVDFIFMPGKGHEKYRFIAEGKRNKKKFDEVDINRRAFNWKDNNWIPIEVGDIEKIIGLSYVNFKRTIIIPQGKFEEFLNLTEGKRTEMMKEIFHLQKYDLSNEVRGLELKNISRKDVLNGEISAYKDINAELIEKKENELEKIKKSAHELREKLGRSMEKKIELDKIKDVFENIKKQEDNIKILLDKEEGYIKLEQEIKDIEYCIHTFKSRIEKIDELNREIEDSKIHLKNKKKDQQVVHGMLIKQEEELDQIKKVYDERGNLEIKLEELKKVIEVKQSRELLNLTEERIEKGNVLYLEKEKAIQYLKEKVKQDHTKLVKLKEEKPDTAMLVEIKNWFVEKNGILKSLKNIEKEVEKISIELEEFDKPVSIQLGVNLKEIFKENFTGLDLNGFLEYGREEKVRVEEENKILDEKIAHLSLQSKLEEYAQNLKEGEPCPLCGSSNHPGIFSLENQTKQLHEIQKKKEGNQDKIKQLLNFELKLSSLLDRKKLRMETRGKLLVQLKKEKQQLTNHEEKFTWEGFEDIDEKKISIGLDKAKELSRQTEEIENSIQVSRQKIESEVLELEKYKKKLDELIRVKTTANAKIETLLAQFKTFSFDYYENKDNNIIDKEIKDISESLGKVEKQFLAIEVNARESRKKMDVISGQIQEAENELAKKQKVLEETHIRLREDMIKSKFENEVDIRNLLESKRDIEKEKESISLFKQNLHSTREQLLTLHDSVKGKNFDKLEYETFLSGLEIIKKQAEESNDLWI
ncbi:MAG: AAA family ATPase, partial [Bacteroidota bacterium]